MQQVAHAASSNYEYLQAMGFEKDKDFAAMEKLSTKAGSAAGAEGLARCGREGRREDHRAERL